MNPRIKIIAILTVLIIGLTACTVLPEETQNLLSAEQATLPAEQPSQTVRPQFDLASAAKQLGVTEEELKSALGPPGQGPPDFAAVAAKLDVPQQELIDSLNVPTGDPANSNQATSQGQPSGEQPSVQTPLMIFLSTVTLMIVIIFIMQGGLILFSTVVIKSYKGVREAAIATFSMAFGFLSMRIGNMMQANQLTAGFISNLLLMSGFVLIYLAICRFTDKPLNRWLVFGFAPLSYLVLTASWFLEFRWLPLIYVSAVLIFVFNVASAATLYRSDHRRYRLAAYLTALPLFIYGLVSIGRIIVGYFNPSQVMPGPSLSAISEIMALFIFSYFWSSGFILMLSQRLQSDLNDLAMNDALTRIRNRRAMQDKLDFEMRRVESEVREFSIILLDIDHFKRVNDTYGHDVGDMVLLWLASTLQSEMRVQDMVARWGGEEFLILLPDTRLDEAMQIAERLRAVIDSSQIEIPTGEIHITFSAGVSNSTTSRDVDRLCKVADQALYIAKETRNQVISQEAIPAEAV